MCGIHLPSAGRTRQWRRPSATIGDLLNYKDELDRIKEKPGEAAVGLAESAYPNEYGETEISGSEEERKDRILFERLDSMVTREKLFLNPDLSRENFVRITGLNKNKVGKMLLQNTGLSTTGYINKKRLEYAAKLLRNSPDNIIQNIAEICGLPNVPTFNRLFRIKFGMTPREYRKTF